DIDGITQLDDTKFFLNSGVPHHVEFTDDVKAIDVEHLGRKIRYSVDGGTNVNFVQVAGDTLIVRTYERGVEGETLACGTGATAAAVAAHYSGRIHSNRINIRVLGGELQIAFDPDYHNVTLTGSARQVFKGEIEWKNSR
ncbi:MAG: diaminopimelate epimerase, partial [Rikenellaceae bacterium]